jgi:hypothetical protein
MALFVGLGGVIVAVSQALIPGIVLLVQGAEVGKALWEIATGATTAAFFAYVFYDGLRSGRPRIIDDDVELS